MSDFKNTLTLIRPFYRGIPIIAAVMLLSVMAAKKYLHYTTPMYESVAHIKLADAQLGIPHSNLYRDFDVFASSNKIGAEVEMVRSQVVIERALEKLDLGFTAYRVGDIHKTELYNDCPFSIVPDSVGSDGYDFTYQLSITKDSVLQVTTPAKQTVTATFNHLITLPKARFRILRNDSLLARKPGLLVNDRYEFMLNSEHKLVDELKGKVDVMYMDKETPILRIAYKTPVAQKSADIVNAIAEAYIKDYVGEKYAAADTTVDFLNKEVADYNNKLTASEGAMENFRKKNNVVNLKQEAETGLRSIAELRNKRAGLEMDLKAIDSLDNYVKKGRGHFEDLATNFTTFNDLLSTELLKKIKSLQSDRHDLLLKYTAENDKVKVVDAKLDDMYSYLEEAVKNTRENLQIKFDDLNNSIASQEEAFADYPYKDRSMTTLERNSHMNEQIFRFLHEKRTDAEIAKAANISFHRIISRGEVPKKPVSPNPALMKVLAGFLGFLGSIFFIYLVHFLKNRINDENNIYKHTDTPLFAKIPFLKNHKQRVYVFGKMIVDMQVKKMLDNKPLLVISSFADNEGKRTIASGVAEGIAELGKKVLLVDTDGSLPVAATETTTLLSLKTAHPNWRNPDQLETLLQAWKTNFDVVVIKNAALDTNPSALLLMAKASQNLLVLDSRLTSMKKIEETDSMKEASLLSNIQFVLNRDGYTPSLWSQCFQWLSKISFFKRFSKSQA